MEKSKLTKREAIRECKRLWKEIKASGLSKGVFLRSAAGEKWREKDYKNSCPLCEYSGNTCDRCPLWELPKMKGCSVNGFTANKPPSDRWMAAVMGLRE